MDGEIACKLARLKSIFDDLDARITALGQYEQLVANSMKKKQDGECDGW